MNNAPMTWDRFLNGSAESQATRNPGDFKVIIVAKCVGDFGIPFEIALIRERGSWYIQRPDYSERFNSKRAAIASCPEIAAALAA